MFKDKTLLVTASSTGIGFSISKAFALQGANVVITSRKQKNVDDAVQQLQSLGVKNVIGLACSSSNKDDIEKLVNLTIQKFKKIDILIANLAVSTHTGSILDISEKQMKKMTDTNLISTVTLIQTCHRHMQKDSNIIIISSYAGYELTPNPIAFYSITKTALFALTKVLARQFQDEEIRVNCIAPGVIKTNFSKGLWEGNDNIEDTLGVNRLGEVEDISNAALFLASKNASFITGEVLSVCGKPISRL